MTSRTSLGLVFTLAVGMALGYAVRPAAQAPQTPADQFQQSYSVKILSGSQGTVRLILPAVAGAQQVLESSEIDLYLTKDELFFRARGGPATTDRPVTGVFAIRVPAK